MKSFNEWADEFSEIAAMPGAIPGAAGEEEQMGPEDIQIAQSLKNVLQRFFAQLERNRRMSRVKKMQILELVLDQLGLKKRDVAAAVRQWSPQ